MGQPARPHRPPGSSPLTRGKRVRVSPFRFGRRLIPAHAGKTSTWTGQPSTVPAHPRSRGENSVREGHVPVEGGSSPLTRGKLHAEGPPALRGRLIPAHAGKTSARGGRPCPPAAHPRSRGENLVMRELWESEFGSSPLTRGKHTSRTMYSASGRLIPAHAGKTCPPSLATTSAPAHPRSRGENCRAARALACPAGSSPLTRGKRRHNDQHWQSLRLIPAHAGKTSTRCLGPDRRAAHPRSRGENGLLGQLDNLGQGSSPLTRGKPQRA